MSEEMQILGNTPTPPIFIVDGLDVGVFASVDDAVLQLEAVDVNNGEYSSYDAEGRSLRLTTDGERVIAQLAETEPSHADELSTVLRDFLKAVGVDGVDDCSCDLQCLVEISRKFIYSPPRFWPFRKRSRK